MKVKLIVCLLWAAMPLWAAGDPEISLQTAPIDLMDYASLQRGAKVFMERCAGCHSLQYIRYDSLAEGIGITDETGEVLKDIVLEKLHLTGDKLSDPVLTALDPKDAKEWFGIAPPDLSLVTRSRGTDWVYTYLKTYYIDPTQPWGVNNLLYPNSAMPHVLVDLQGEQHLQITPNGQQLVLTKAGRLSAEEYDSLLTDLVNFLTYVGEPIRLERERLGRWVLVFIAVFTVFAYLLKREYWKEVH